MSREHCDSTISVEREAQYQLDPGIVHRLIDRGAGRMAVAATVFASIWTFSASALAQQPACAAVPEAGRSCVDVIVVAPAAGNQARTGTGTFAADDEPGNDASGLNHVIRSLDLIVYEVRYRVLNQDASDVHLSLTLPPGVDFANPANPAFANAPVPTPCTAGSTIAGATLDCALGNVAQGVTRSVLLYARPRFGTADGAILRLQTSIGAANQQSTGAVSRVGYQDTLSEAPIVCDVHRLGVTQTLQPCGDVVSARPRFDLELAGFATTSLTDRSARGPDLLSVALSSSITTVVGGAAGRAGYVLTLPVAIALPGEGAGSAPLSAVGPIPLTLQLANSDALAAFGELVGCGVNGNDDPAPNGTRVSGGWAVGATEATSLRAKRHPYGTVGLAGATAEDAAYDSGQMSCTQSVAGGDIGINIVPTTNTFNPASFATRNADGSSTPRRYVFVGLVVLFYPADRVLPPSSGGTGDGSVNVRFNLGQQSGAILQGLRINGVDEPDAPAINDGFAAVGSYDDDNNNFINASLDTVGATYAKLWRNPRADTATAQSATCLKDGVDPHCRHGYAFPGANIQSLFIYNYRDFVARADFAVCDEWDSSRTRLRRPFDPMANANEMPPGEALLLELGGLNGSPDVLAAMGLSVEVSVDAGNVANVDWQPVEPDRTRARSQVSAPECTSGNWMPAQLPPALVGYFNPVALPASLESPPGSGIYPAIKRIRVRASSLPPFVTVGLRGSYEVIASAPGTRLPNRTSYRFAPETLWTYAENDHAIVRSADTAISLAVSRNLDTGAVAPITSIGFGETIEYAINVSFSSGDAASAPSAFPLVVNAYLPVGLDFVPGSASPALHAVPYAGSNPETGQAATVLEWRIANPVAGATQPRLTYHVRAGPGVGNGSNLHTSATVEHPLDTGPLYIEPVSGSSEDRLAVADVVASVPSGLLTTMTALTPFIDLGGIAGWQLGVVNTTDAAFSSLRLISLTPRVGDAINAGNAFSGGFVAGQVAGLASGATLYYSTSLPAQVNRNPNCASNGGALPDGTGACPGAGATWVAAPAGALPAGVTAIRIDDARALSPTGVTTFTLTLNTGGNRAADLYENSFTAVAPGQSLVVQSPRSTVRVPAGEIRGAVFSDNDDSHSPTVADSGIAGVTIVLTGADPHGNTYRITTRTVAGRDIAAVENSVSVNGANAAVRWCDASPVLQEGEYLFCHLPSADSAGYTLHEQQPPDYLDREDYAGALGSAQPGGIVSANDTISGIRLRNDLVTGAADFGRNYLFSEYPVFTSIHGRVYHEGNWPLNQIDDGNSTDPGLSTTVSVSCTPATTGSSTAVTGADGLFEFSGIPIGATCVLTETQPPGYLSYYNVRGTGAFADSGGAGTGPSTLSIVVPAGGSRGNAFAEIQITDTTSTITCAPSLPNPGETVTCTVVCTNHGPGLALNMHCEIANAASIPNIRIGDCARATPVVPGDAITCRSQFVMSASLTEVIAGSSAVNDVNGGAIPTAGNNPSRAPLAQQAEASPPRPVALPPLLPWLLALLLIAVVSRRNVLRSRLRIGATR